MNDRIIKNAREILKGIEIGFFDTAKPWNEENYEEYFRHFNDPNPEVRKYALLIFGAALGNWQMKSAFVFPRATDPDPQFRNMNERKIYRFENYIQAFLENKEAIQKEFPTLYKSIIINLILLDQEVPFENDFPGMNSKSLADLRKTIGQSGFTGQSQFSFNQILREVGIPTFFKNG